MCDRALGDQIHDRHEQEWFMRGSVQHEGRVSISVSFRSKVGKLTEIYLYHHEPFRAMEVQWIDNAKVRFKNQ